MSTRLTLWLADGPLDASDTPWYWHVPGLQSGLAETAEEKAALSRLGHKTLWVIIPGQWVRVVPLDLPKMRSSERLQAAGFALEEHIGSALSEQHIALPTDEIPRAGIMGKAKLAALYTALKNYNLFPDRILADFDALTVLMPVRLEDRIIVPGTTPDMQGQPGYTLDPEVYDSLPDVKPASPVALDDLTAQLSDEGAVNFINAKYRSHALSSQSFTGLARAACLLAVLGVGALAWTGLSARAVNLQADELKAQTRQIYETATGERAPANPALTVTRANRDAGPVSADFMTLSALLFQAVEQTDNVLVDSVQYDQAQNRLTVRLIYPGFETASQLERTVSQLGGSFRTGGVREQGDQLVGDAVLTLGGV